MLTTFITKRKRETSRNPESQFFINTNKETRCEVEVVSVKVYNSVLTDRSNISGRAFQHIRAAARIQQDAVSLLVIRPLFPCYKGFLFLFVLVFAPSGDFLNESLGLS